MLAAILASQAIGLAATAILVGASGDAVGPPAALLWGGAAGLCGIVGLGAFYLALARGTMGLIAPLAALIGAGLPAIVAIVGGEVVGPLRLAGMGIALAGVVLISLPGGERTAGERRAARIDVQDLPLVLLSGLGFAGFYILLDMAVDAGGGIWWPLLAVRAVGLSVVIATIAWAVARAGGRRLRDRLTARLGVARLRLAAIGLFAVPLFAIAGFGDLGGNVFFVLANDQGSLAVAVVLSSLYPVVTAMLAVILLHERLRGLQTLGIVLAVVGVALISGGDELVGELPGAV